MGKLLRRRGPIAIQTAIFLFLMAMGSGAWASDWTAEQRAAFRVLQAACEALKQGKMEMLTPLYHERFVGWDLAQPAPLARAAFMEAEADLLKSVQSFESSVTPLMIEIVGDTAALQVTYRNTVVMADGKREVLTGRWSATLVRKDGSWLFLSNAFAADE
jgi:hypothetical protein